MKRYLICLISLGCFINVFSQNRYNTWYFGYHAGLDFNTSPPTVLNNSFMVQDEGTASICNNNGQILFYSNGEAIWNRNHQVMLNGTGLLGGQSSTQSVLIIPKPLDNNIYYVFTVPTTSIVTPLSYSIVDMTLDGGLGAVTATKNVPLHASVMEKLTATLQSNGTDYWVIAKEFGTDVILSYSLTSAGINTSPVISHTGFVITNLSDIGYARVSPNGTKLCIAYTASFISQLFDFDNSTGLASNPVDLIIPYLSAAVGPYGVEFSPDNSKLYIMQTNLCTLRQYDLLAGSPAAIQNSVAQIYIESPGNYGGALMAGPDGKIYVIHYYKGYMSVIDQPNLAGTACNFVFHAVTLVAGSPSTMGLPNNINYPAVVPCVPAQNISSNVNICANQTYQLPSGIIVSTTGIYLDTIQNQAATCDSIIYTINLSVYSVSLLNTLAHICSNETYQLASGTVVNAEGIYSDTLINIIGCDSIINTIHLVVNDLSFTNQVDSIFEGQNYTLPSGVVVSAPGTYQSVLTNSLGCDSVITTTIILRKTIAVCITLKNAITPNGDGINDYWVLYRYLCFKKLEVSVYNRYGSLVYRSWDYKNDWNGKYNNQELPDGTYYYVIKVFAYDGKQHVFRDNVTIVR